MDAQLPPGTTIGRYRIERWLGAGHMGTVYEVVDEGGTHLALKCLLHERYWNDVDLLARFEREAQVCRALVSPHIVPVLDHGVHPETGPFFIMRLLRGADLQQWLEHHAPLAPEAAAAIGVQICGGLAVAHARGVVHRDLKPANVFLDDTGDGRLIVVLCDFGLAKICEDTEGTAPTSGLTATGALLGTPHYIAPEQFFDAKRVDHRSDVWAVAMILYHALAGHPAFVKVRSYPDMVVALRRGYAPPLKVAAPWIDPGLAELIDRGLRPPAERIGSVLVLQEALARFAAPGAHIWAAGMGPVSSEC